MVCIQFWTYPDQIKIKLNSKISLIYCHQKKLNKATGQMLPCYPLSASLLDLLKQNEKLKFEINMKVF